MASTTNGVSHNPLYVYYVGFIAALAGLLFGVDTGIISGALVFIKQQYQFSSLMLGLLVSCTLIGAVCGTLISNYISRHYGRKVALLCAGLLFVIGALGSALAISPVFLIAVRFLLGLAIGVASYTAPLYLAEISPRNVRGKIIAFYQLMIAAGLLAAYVADYAFTPMGAWRWMLGVPVVPAMIMLVAALFLPRSPRWLIVKQRFEEAKQVLIKMLPAQQADSEFNEIAERVKADQRSVKGWRAIYNPKFRIVLLLGLGLQLLQQWSGCNIVLYYAPIIFKTAGLASPQQQMLATIGVGAVMMLTTIVAVKYVDKWGRRPILFVGLTIMTIGLLALALVTSAAQHSILLQYVAIVMVLFYIFGFAISLGPVVWILCSEIFPIFSRDFGIMITTAGNWLFNALLAQVFPLLLAHLQAKSFLIFAVVCILGLIFVKRYVPETKGVSLEDIEANLLSGKRVRDIGVSKQISDTSVISVTSNYSDGHTNRPSNCESV